MLSSTPRFQPFFQPHFGIKPTRREAAAAVLGAFLAILTVNLTASPAGGNRTVHVALSEEGDVFLKTGRVNPETGEDVKVINQPFQRTGDGSAVTPDGEIRNSYPNSIDVSMLIGDRTLLGVTSPSSYSDFASNPESYVPLPWAYMRSEKLIPRQSLAPSGEIHAFGVQGYTNSAGQMFEMRWDGSFEYVGYVDNKGNVFDTEGEKLGEVEPGFKTHYVHPDGNPDTKATPVVHPVPFSLQQVGNAALAGIFAADRSLPTSIQLNGKVARVQDGKQGSIWMTVQAEDSNRQVMVVEYPYVDSTGQEQSVLRALKPDDRVQVRGPVDDLAVPNGEYEPTPDRTTQLVPLLRASDQDDVVQVRRINV